MATLETGDPILLVVPAQAIRWACGLLGDGPHRLVICAKGIERDTGRRLSEVVAEACPRASLAVLSGPSFAREVAAELPTALTLAASTQPAATALADLVTSRSFRVYPTDDMAGVEIGGALKNVIAIAAGVVGGRGLGENARAAVVTRGLAELARLARALGARTATLMGLSGLGDLVLTTSSLTSRNTAFGHALGQGRPLASLLAPGEPLAEGVWTAGAACALAKRHGVELPLSEAVRAVVAGEIPLEDAIEGLLARPVPGRE
jgi:glycerol-3-phosphate dehydrogenase (NAD(P)+)